MSQIPIQNVYYLLCYAWDHLEERDLVDVAGAGQKDLANLFARVLINGTQRLIKRGFHRGYQEHSDETPRLRGRLAFTPSLRRLSWLKGQMVCEFTELTYDTLPNRILKATLRQLLFTEGLEKDKRDLIGGLVRELHEVRDIRLHGRRFRRVQFNQNMRAYRFLLNVCELVYEALLPSEEAGRSRFRDFLQDPKKMPLLFEAFVRNFYQRQADAWKVDKSEYRWQEVQAVTEGAEKLLPIMKTDVELQRGDELIILDCKFYVNAFTENHGVTRFHTSNLYQLYAYLMNRRLKDPHLRIQGMLLYPENGTTFHHALNLQGFPITIASLNLDQPWQQIETDLLSLIAV
ncbi:MAG: restriction endonuclease [Opitutales bacterium]